mgnify:CR=1 FL=1
MEKEECVCDTGTLIEVKNILGTTIYTNYSENLIGNYTRKIDLTDFSKGNLKGIKNLLEKNVFKQF